MIVSSAGPPQHLPRYRLARTLTGHTRGVVSVKFSADGALLASASADKTVRIWAPATGELIRVLEGHTQVCEVRTLTKTW